MSVLQSSDQSDNLDEFFPSCQARVDELLKSCLENSSNDEKLKEALLYACLNGGKRIRPILVYATALAVDCELAIADAPACAVELIHSYSLVHDDLPAMDDDDLRRGKPSVHKAYDEATAILVGDALQSLAFNKLAMDSELLSSNIRIGMVNCLASAIGPNGMVGGQFEDFKITGTETTIEALEALHRQKTGALIRASVELGAMCNPNLEQAQFQALLHYAACIGLAFQVQDDVLDVVSDTETLGKPQGSDQHNNKSTYVTLLGLEEAKEKALGLVEEAQGIIAEFSQAADPLRNLASYIVNRSH